MAIIPKDRYPGQIDISDLVGYPQGKAQNITAPGDGNGTPWERDVVNDVFGMQQELLAKAALVPSGTPDKVGASQYVEAILKLNDQYPEPVSRTVLLRATPIASGRSDGTSAWRVNGNNANSVVNDGDGDLPLQLPQGAKLTRVRALVKPGAARLGLARLLMNLRSHTPDWVTPGAGAGVIIAGAFDDESTDYQFLDTDVIDVDIDNTTTTYALAFQSGSDSPSAHVSDQILSIELTFLDPGPRNY